MRSSYRIFETKENRHAYILFVLLVCILKKPKQTNHVDVYRMSYHTWVRFPPSPFGKVARLVRVLLLQNNSAWNRKTDPPWAGSRGREHLGAERLSDS